MYGSESWGRYPKVRQKIVPLAWRNDSLPVDTPTSMLPFGYGRSYGDVCLNDGGTVLTTSRLKNCIQFDSDNGRIRVEAGISLAELLQIVVPAGWFIPVSPGTQFVSIGGAIANDIHGKNHHRAGTFGRHILRMLVRRFDGEEIICSPDSNHLFFNATIAGLGLTGLIVWAEIQLIPIANSFIVAENIPFGSLEEFLEISEDSEKDFDYTVSWLDCVSSGSSFGRGIFMRGNHAPPSKSAPEYRPLPIQPMVPIDFPAFALNSFSVKAFNTLYYHAQKMKSDVHTTPYQPFFYPLDSVLSWNRIYGKGGFLQFQCVIEKTNGINALRTLLKASVASGQASFLAVLKEFGAITSPGLLSFPRPGFTLCMDFPFRGSKTTSFMRTLEEIVVANGGALYPAKDACMSSSTFQHCYPNCNAFIEYKDPKASSSFWRRVMGEGM